MDEREKQIQRALGTLVRYHVALRGPIDMLGRVPRPKFECDIEAVSQRQAIDGAIVKWQEINPQIHREDIGIALNIQSRRISK